MKITLFQPRYPYGKSQVYLPGGLMNLGSRLLAAGVEVSFFDLNLTPLGDPEVTKALQDSDFVGFSVLGPPYVPQVLKHIQELRQSGFLLPILIGGEGISRVQAEDFSQWFQGLGEILQVRNDSDLIRVLKLPRVNSMFETSMVPMIRLLEEDTRRQYLTKEFSLFISNGCMFNCNFCAAAKARREEYRTCSSLTDEVEYVCGYIASVGHHTLTAYLTNLDAFQNVEQLEERLTLIARIAQKHGVKVVLRVLATSRCTTKACAKDPQLAGRLHHLGLHVVGFGADGADEKTWREQNKNHNTRSELEFAATAMQEAGIEVEFLMIVGFPGQDAKAMWHGFSFSLKEARKGRWVRPYLAKAKAATGQWRPEEANAFREKPVLLTRLDYAMLGSKETHENPWNRWLANGVYMAIIVALSPFNRCRTSPLLPIPEKGLGRRVVQLINRLMPFDK